MPEFLHRCWVLNSGLHIGMVWTLPTEPSPQILQNLCFLLGNQYASMSARVSNRKLCMCNKPLIYSGQQSLVNFCYGVSGRFTRAIWCDSTLNAHHVILHDVTAHWVHTACYVQSPHRNHTVWHGTTLSEIPQVCHTFQFIFSLFSIWKLCCFHFFYKPHIL